MEKLTRLIPKFSRQKIMVLGDVMVDRFVWGKVSRISPEAPVPVVEVTKETQALGGAGNVAHNLTSFGSRVHLVGVIGEDFDGDQLKAVLKEKGIGHDGLICDASRPTCIKTRIIASHQQVVRVDKEIKGLFSGAVEKALLGRVEELVPSVDAIVISDYGKGVVNQKVLTRAITLARKKGIPVTVDPKIEHFLRYKKVSCITPNIYEAIAGMRSPGVRKDNDEEVFDLGRRILKKLNSESVLITRGEKGMTLFEPGDRITHIPTRAKEVFDVTGAGDTVIATFTLALAARARLAEAAEISNFAAGVVVAKLGTATVSPDELRSAILAYSKDGGR